MEENMQSQQMAVEMQPVMDQGKTKKRGVAKWIVLGALVGTLVSAGLFLLLANFYSDLTGGYLILGKHGVKSASTSQVITPALAAKLDEINEHLGIYFYDDLDDEALEQALLHGYVEGVGDKYTVYYNPTELQDLLISTSGTYGGIGAGLAQDKLTNEVTISKVYAGTPAEEAGLMKDDMILAVGEGDEQVEATSMELTNLVQLIRGEEGTYAHLVIYRPSIRETIEVDVERRQVQLPSIEGEMLEDQIGYIQISEFQTNTAEQFIAKYEELAAAGMKGLIVDLRDNPGGLLNSVCDILDYILPEGIVVYTEDKYGARVNYSSAASHIEMPMVVLVNGNSASASEIFAGAIKDYGYGTLLGTTTFGKGIVQSIFPLSSSDAIKVTTARYFTPKGNFIHGTGIDPDIVMEYEFLGPEDATSYEKQYDNQLLKAQELLKQ